MSVSDLDEAIRSAFDATWSAGTLICSTFSPRGLAQRSKNFWLALCSAVSVAELSTVTVSAAGVAAHPVRPSARPWPSPGLRL